MESKIRFFLTANPKDAYQVVKEDNRFNEFSMQNFHSSSPNSNKSVSQHLHIQNGRILGRSNIILNDKNICCYNNLVFNPRNDNKIYCGDDEDFSVSDKFIDYFFNSEIGVDKAIFIGTNNNFGHWINNHWLRIFQLKIEFFKDYKWIVSDTISRTQLESMTYAGVEEDAIIQINKNQVVNFRSLFIPQMPWLCIESGNLPVMSVYWTPDIFPYFRNKLNLEKSGTFGQKKIFLSRGKAKWRRLVNESDIFVSIKKRGYEMILAEDLSFSEQINLAGQTKDLISVFGAGTNFFLFMPDYTNVIELTPPINQMLVNRFFAKASNVNYTQVFGKHVDGGSSKILERDFFIDIQDLRNI